MRCAETVLTVLLLFLVCSWSHLPTPQLSAETWAKGRPLSRIPRPSQRKFAAIEAKLHARSADGTSSQLSDSRNDGVCRSQHHLSHQTKGPLQSSEYVTCVFRRSCLCRIEMMDHQCSTLFNMHKPRLRCVVSKW